MEPKRKLRGWTLAFRILITLVLLMAITAMAVPDLFLYGLAIYWPF